MAKVSEILKKRMSDLNQNADQVAEFCGVNRSTVFRWLNGDIDNMKRSNIASLAKILNLDPALIVGDLENSEPQTEETYIIPIFKTAQEAIKFILQQPLVAAYGGYDLDSMSDEELIDFANRVAQMIQIMHNQK